MNSDILKLQSEHLRALAWTLDRCRQNLPGNSVAQEFLRKNGLADEAVWAAFRVGVGDKDMLQGVSPEGRAALDDLGLLPYKGPCVLWDGGILLPTFNPAEVLQPVGFIKVNYGQNKHAFVTPAQGLACTAEIGECERVVIADAPLLALRLLSAGVKGVAVAEKPEVLPALMDWLSGREVVLVSYKQKSLGAYQKIMPSAAFAAVHTELLRSNADTLKLLGIVKSVVAPVVVPTPRLPAVLRKIVEYSAEQLASGNGLELLTRCGADCKAFVDAYRLGYLPSEFQTVLPQDAKSVLPESLRGDCIIVPALDEDGIAVGALTVDRNGKQTWIGEKGLIAPGVASAFKEVKIAQSWQSVGALFGAGEQNALLIPSIENAQAVAGRLLDSGVRAYRIVHGVEIAEGIRIALNSAGMSEQIELPAPVGTGSPVDVEGTMAGQYPAKPELVNHDVRNMRAKFRAGDARYEIETALDCGSKLELRVEREGLVHLDRFDMSKAAQRKRFSESAALKTKTPFEVIEAHLIHLLDAVRGLQEELLNPAARKAHTGVGMSEKDIAEARELLKQPNLLDLIAEDMEALGWTGEDANKRLLYLCSVSRLLTMPVSAALRGPASAGKSCSLETVCALTPPEDVVHISRASAAAFHLHPDLRHKLVLIDEADALSQEVVVALRVLQSRGALSQSVVERDALTGKSVARIGETKGPISVLTSTTQEMDAEFISRCYDLPVDTSPEQTQRILQSQRRVRADIDQQGTESRRAVIIRRHHAVQRVLTAAKRVVVIPFSDRIEFPSSAVQYRREQQKLLSLVEASALLHSFNRLKEKNRSGDEVIIADLRDFEIAVQLVSGLICRANDELSANAWDVLKTLRKANLSTFTLAEVQSQRPDWTRHKIYAGLEGLARVEIVTCSRGRGKTRQYVLQASAASFESSIVRLRPVGELSKLSNPLDNNFTPTQAIG